MSFHDDKADLALLLQQFDPFPAYQGYTPLNKDTRSIRLLHVSIRGNDEIHGTITHTSLDNPTDYEALSYCWGPPDVPKIIYINDEAVSIRASLHTLLHALCRHDPLLPVWVDAICIDQSNVSERNWQVSLMGEIYRGATRVKAWLGPSDPYSNYVFAYLHHRRDERIALAGHNRTSQIASEALEIILRRIYWQRLWIVQEMALARHLWIVCGDRMVKWEDFIELLDHLRLPYTDIISSMKDLRGSVHSSVLSTHYILPRLTKLLAEVHDFSDALHEFRRGGRRKNQHYVSDLACTETRMMIPEESLLRQMLRFSKQASGEPKDKIFALLSIATDSDEVKVDYSRMLSDVIMDAVVASWRTFLALLKQAEYEHRHRHGHGSSLAEIVPFGEVVQAYHFFLFLDCAAMCLVNVGLEGDCRWALSTISDTEVCGEFVHLLEAREALRVFLTARPPLVVSPKVLPVLSPLIIQWEHHDTPPKLRALYDEEPLNSYKDPADVHRALIKFGEISLCAQAHLVQISGILDCCFTVHYSRLATLTLMARKGTRQNSQGIVDCLEARRKKTPEPNLCKCEVSAQLNREAFEVFQRARLEAKPKKIIYDFSYRYL